MEVITQRHSVIENGECLSARILTDSQLPCSARITDRSCFCPTILLRPAVAGDSALPGTVPEHFL